MESASIKTIVIAKQLAWWTQRNDLARVDDEQPVGVFVEECSALVDDDGGLLAANTAEELDG